MNAVSFRLSRPALEGIQSESHGTLLDTPAALGRYRLNRPARTIGDIAIAQRRVTKECYLGC